MFFLSFNLFHFCCYVSSAFLAFHVLCYLCNLVIKEIIHDFLIFIINIILILIHCWHRCPLCEILIVAFVIETKFFGPFIRVF